jgi:hypothetical protein
MRFSESTSSKFTIDRPRRSCFALKIEKNATLFTISTKRDFIVGGFIQKVIFWVQKVFYFLFLLARIQRVQLFNDILLESETDESNCPFSKFTHLSSSVKAAELFAG